MSGEDVCLAGGHSNFIVRQVCPEVALFDQSRFFPGLGGYVTTVGQYDKYLEPQYSVFETAHFSECAEYNFAAHGPAPLIIKNDRGFPVTMNTFHIQDLQGGAVSLGGDANNSGRSEFQYPEPLKAEVLARLAEA